MEVFEHGTTIRRLSLTAGEIGRVRGLVGVQVGDAIGKSSSGNRRHFALPTLETVVLPKHSTDKGRLRVALDQLAEQDPLINVRQNDMKQEVYVSLYGEVQKQVIEATLTNDYGIAVVFSETRPICVERPVKRGEAVEYLRENGNPFLATVGLRVEPAPTGAGIRVKIEAPLESLPLYVYKSISAFEEPLRQYVSNTLQHGLHGWRVVDALVTLTTSGYESPGSTAGDFRKLTNVVLISALRQAGTTVCEPVCRYELEVPAANLTAIMSALGRLRAAPHTTTMSGSVYILKGDIPSVHINNLQQQLPNLTSGEGFMEYTLERYDAAH